jgi:SWI/SNF-related matrix-associated actin-dependent regulator 1 of chromatin subfamily A
MDASPEGATWFNRHNPMNYAATEHLIYPPKPYQILGLNRMLMGSCALWLSMGLGKTFLTLMYCLKICVRHEPNLFLIVCPLSVFVTWEQEVAKHIAPAAHAKIVFAHGAKKKDVLSKLRTSTSDGPTFIVTSYETLKTIRENLQELPLKAIFIDEASRVKNVEAARTKAMFELVRALASVPRYALSGTPSTTNPVGYFSLYELLCPGASGHTNIISFKHTYTEQKRFLVAEVPTADGQTRLQHVLADGGVRWLQKNYPPGSSSSYSALGYSFEEQPKANQLSLKVVKVYNKDAGVRNIDQLQRVTDTWAYVVKKEDVLDQLPPKGYVQRQVEMSDEQNRVYNELVENCRTMIGEVRFSFRNLSSPFIKLIQVANGFLVNQDKTVTFFNEQPKLAELLALLEEANGEKMIIWSPWRPQIAQICTFLTENNINNVFLHGDVSPEQRLYTVAKFQNHEETQILVANPAVAGMGLNLTVAHLETFMSNWFKPDDRIQAEDRTHRTGQEFPVTITDILAKNTLESKILNTLMQRISLEGEILTVSDLTGGA